MSKTETTKAAPTYRIYTVSGESGESVWTEIGAAWRHRDGKGLNLQFRASPLQGDQLVLREPKAKAEFPG